MSNRKAYSFSEFWKSLLCCRSWGNWELCHRSWEKLQFPKEHLRPTNFGDVSLIFWLQPSWSSLFKLCSHLGKHQFISSVPCCCLVTQLCLTLFDPMDCSCQAPLSMELSRQEYWSGLPFPPPGDLPDPGIEPVSPALAGGFFTTEPPGKPTKYFTYYRLYQYA